jgi:hypothetical protein
MIDDVKYIQLENRFLDYMASFHMFSSMIPQLQNIDLYVYLNHAHEMIALGHSATLATNDILAEIYLNKE